MEKRRIYLTLLALSLQPVAVCIATGADVRFLEWQNIPNVSVLQTLAFILYVIVRVMLCLLSELNVLKNIRLINNHFGKFTTDSIFPNPILFTCIFFFVSCFFHSDLDWCKHWVMVVINQSDCADFNFQPCSSLTLFDYYHLPCVMGLGVFSLYSISEAAEELLFCWSTGTASTTMKKRVGKERKKKKEMSLSELRKESSALKLLWNYFVLLVSLLPNHTLSEVSGNFAIELNKDIMEHC